MSCSSLQQAPLGKKTDYIDIYTPGLLFPIPRQMGREDLNIGDQLIFSGNDSWTAYELSWLTQTGKPQIAAVEINFPCESQYLIESKSLKLYLNSFNQTAFTDKELVLKTIANDLSNAVKATVEVEFISANDLACQELPGESLDDLDISTDTYQIDTSSLSTKSIDADEQLFTHLFRSNCLKTGQPDWGSVFIHYRGNKIDRNGLLKYLISFRLHKGFHEHCVEKIFVDLINCCSPTHLTVYARYLRRGGLDINPFRSNFEQPPKNLRLYRQ